MTIILPQGLKELLAPRLKNNETGFQRAHVTGRETWNDDIKWLSKFGFCLGGNGSLAANDDECRIFLRRAA
jgi:hypothetical protein